MDRSEFRLSAQAQEFIGFLVDFLFRLSGSIFAVSETLSFV